MTAQQQWEFEARAREQLKPVPDPVFKTFLLLVEAFISGTELNTVDMLYLRASGDSPEAVRNRLTVLRQQLPGKVFLLPGLGQCEFDIPYRQPYRLEKAKTINQSLLWAPHTSHSDKVLVHTYERLFFRFKTAYIRDVRVNQTGDFKKVTDLLPCMGSDSLPSMHYVSSGEIRAAIVLQNFFSNHGIKKAELSTGAEITQSKQNLIVLGSARLDASELDAPGYEKYKVFDNGISEGKKHYTDKSDNPNRRTVYVLLSRRQTLSGDCIQTIIESGHGRAIQGLCEALTAKDNSLCSDLISSLKGEHDLMPVVFQAIFRVVLITGTDFVSRATPDTHVVTSQPYFPDKQHVKSKATVPNA